MSFILNIAMNFSSIYRQMEPTIFAPKRMREISHDPVNLVSRTQHWKETLSLIVFVENKYYFLYIIRFVDCFECDRMAIDQKYVTGRTVLGVTLIWPYFDIVISRSASH